MAIELELGSSPEDGASEEKTNIVLCLFSCLFTNIKRIDENKPSPLLTQHIMYFMWLFKKHRECKVNNFISLVLDFLGSGGLMVKSLETETVKVVLGIKVRLLKGQSNNIS